MHHVVYQQHIRRLPDVDLDDARNLVPVAMVCHAQHHARRRPYELARLPDVAFLFAMETLGEDRGMDYLTRRYALTPPRD